MKSILLVLAIALAASVRAVEWSGLEGANHLYGGAVSAETLENKTVLYFAFDETQEDSVAAFKRFVRIYTGFAGKVGLVMFVAARGGSPEKAKALAAAAKLSCPVYGAAAGFKEAGRTPSFTVVAPDGAVIYRGLGDREATEAMVNAMSMPVIPGLLIPGVELRKFKAMQRDLVLGKNVESKFSQLKAAAKRAGAEADEAKIVLSALDNSRAKIEARIARNLAKCPAAALSDIQAFSKTWPSGAAKYAEDRKRLEASADVKKVVAAYEVLRKHGEKPPQSPTQAKSAAAVLRQQVKQLDALAASEADAVVKDEAAALRRNLETAAATCEAMAAAKRR